MGEERHQRLEDDGRLQTKEDGQQEMELTGPEKLRSCDPDSNVSRFLMRVVMRLGSKNGEKIERN